MEPVLINRLLVVLAYHEGALARFQGRRQQAIHMLGGAAMRFGEIPDESDVSEWNAWRHNAGGITWPIM